MKIKLSNLLQVFVRVPYHLGSPGRKQGIDSYCHETHIGTIYVMPFAVKADNARWEYLVYGKPMNTLDEFKVRNRLEAAMRDSLLALYKNHLGPDGSVLHCAKEHLAMWAISKLGG